MSTAFSYYADGSVKNITRSGDSPLVYYYLLTGQKSQALYPNNARVDYSYDDQGRLTSIINRKPDMSVLSSYTYGYDYDYTTSSYTMKGYRTSMTNHLAQMEKYYFDNLYQLNRVDYPNGDIHQWTYDDIGNRVQQVVIPSGQPPVVTNYTYYQNSQGRNSQLLQSDGLSTYTWDNNGNLLTKASTQYAWDYDDRLVGITGPSTSASYVYDYQGNRIKKTLSGIETSYLYLSEDIVKETTGGVVTNYLHGLGIDDPVMMDRAGAKSYYFSDGLGSIRELTDAMGTVQNSYAYGAWGELRAQSVTVPNSYGYTGREFAEDGLYFYRARYMDPGVGRFLSEDPIGMIVDMNYFRYAINNPINYFDPYGLQLKMPVKEPNKNCCDKDKIKDEIEGTQKIITAMEHGNPPSSVAKGIGGALTHPSYCDPKTGWCNPAELGPEFFNPWGCDNPDPCISYCCKFHEWTHFTDYRPWNMFWSNVELEIFWELPAYESELRCLKSFL